jgi:hypothetical protein
MEAWVAQEAHAGHGRRVDEMHRGERLCIFASPLFSDAYCLFVLPPLLEDETATHSDPREALLHIFVRLSLREERRCCTLYSTFIRVVMKAHLLKKYLVKE